MLLTKEEQQTIKPLAANWINSGTNFDQLESEIEETLLPDILGYALFQDVQTNPTNINNEVLLNGGSFVDCNGNTINFKGIKDILAFAVYNEYVLQSSFKQTYGGIVEKQRNEAQGIRDGEKSRLRKLAENRINQQRDLLVSFLNENSETYPLWICTPKKKLYKPIVNVIRKTIL